MNESTGNPILDKWRCRREITLADVPEDKRPTDPNVWQVLCECVERGEARLFLDCGRSYQVKFSDEEDYVNFEFLVYDGKKGLSVFYHHWNLVVIKASHSGPQWVQIGPGCNPVDLRNHMHLSDEQEAAYQQALLLVKQGDYDGAVEVLKPLFEKVWIEKVWIEKG